MNDRKDKVERDEAGRGPEGERARVSIWGRVKRLFGAWLGLYGGCGSCKLEEENEKDREKRG